MRYCTCDPPVQSLNPRGKGWCASCAYRFDPAWLSNDANFAAFFDRLEDALPTVDLEWQAFRRMCEARERAGREEFGIAYMSRDNLAEAQEESADLAIYPFLDSLRAVHDGRAGEDYDLVLEIAFHAYQAYRKTIRLQHKRHHCP